MEYGHSPVLLRECLEALAVRPEGLYLDGTLGRAGHSLEIARRLTTGRLFCIDRDAAALAAARVRLSDYSDRVTLLHGNFGELGRLCDENRIPPLDGMLFDFGLSSPQLDEAARGLSYSADAPLDMRMDRSQTLTARTVVNEWPEGELKRILWQYGEERYAGRVASAIRRSREKRPIETTKELSEIIRSAMPPAALREKQHPAKRSFQAIRIAVNGELDAIETMLPEAVRRLSQGGRLAVISFHSLEDRLVKTAFQSSAKGCTCPPDFPVCVCGGKATLRILTRKPIVPGEDECAENPRARSARLRAAEKL